MSIDVNPTGIFSSEYEYSANGSLSTTAEGIYIPLANLGGHLTNLEADQAQVTSDYRKILWGMLEEYYHYLDNADASQVPENMTISRTGLTFVDDDTAQRSYNITFRYHISDMDVEAE